MGAVYSSMCYKKPADFAKNEADEDTGDQDKRPESEASVKSNPNKEIQLTPEQIEKKNDEFFEIYDVKRATELFNTTVASTKKIREKSENLLMKGNLQCMNVPIEIYKSEISPDWKGFGENAFLAVATINPEFSTKFFQVVTLNTDNNDSASLDSMGPSELLIHKDDEPEYLRVWKTTREDDALNTRTTVNMHKMLELDSFGVLSEPVKNLELDEFYKHPEALDEEDSTIRGWSFSLDEHVPVYFREFRMESGADEKAFDEHVRQVMTKVAEEMMEEAVRFLCTTYNFEKLKWYTNDDETAEEIVESEKEILIEKSKENSYVWTDKLRPMIEKFAD